MTLGVYKGTVAFPRREQHGLKSQVRRSCASVPANIAEVCGRGTNAGLASIFQMTPGSTSELQYQLLLAHDLPPLNRHTYRRLSGELRRIKRMSASFIESLRAFANQT